jgi:hypothetical protein
VEVVGKAVFLRRLFGAAAFKVLLLDNTTDRDDVVIIRVAGANEHDVGGRVSSSARTNNNMNIVFAGHTI